MNLEINFNDVEKSFDRIANDLIKNYALYVNNTEIRFTEIEFYYFCEEYHEDNYTHEHQREAGEWRFHNQGFDLAFKSDEKSDGGILIRGILAKEEFVNGPRNVIGAIFESFGSAFDTSTIVLKQSITRTVDIYKTYRHLPNKEVIVEFHKKPYRYYTNLDNLKIPNSEKNEIKANSTIL